jgi:hypothetical protein
VWSEDRRSLRGAKGADREGGHYKRFVLVSVLAPGIEDVLGSAELGTIEVTLDTHKNPEILPSMMALTLSVTWLSATLGETCVT